MNNTFSLTTARKLRIKQCTEESSWYAHKVGQLMDYAGEWPEGYVTHDDDGHKRQVLFKDAHIEHVEATPPAPAAQSKVESLTEAAVAACAAMIIVVVLGQTIDQMERLQTIGAIFSPLIFLAAITITNYVTRRLFEHEVTE